MGAIETLRDALFGNPPSPTTEPSREGTLAAFTEMQQNITGIVSGIPAYATAALLPAVTGSDNGKQARVYADGDAENNTYWIVIGGAWAKDTSYEAVLTGAVQPLVDETEGFKDDAAASAAAAAVIKDDVEAAAAGIRFFKVDVNYSSAAPVSGTHIASVDTPAGTITRFFAQVLVGAGTVDVVGLISGKIVVGPIPVGPEGYGAALSVAFLAGSIIEFDFQGVNASQTVIVAQFEGVPV